MKSDKFINHLVRRLKWDDLDENYLLYLVRTARAEDIEGAGLKEKPQKAIDITTATITQIGRASCRERVSSPV